MAWHAQITQNNKVAIFLQYLKKELSDEVDFLHADKHLSFPQIDTMALMGMVKPSQSSKKSKFVVSFNISKNKVDKFDFLHAGKHQSFLQVHFNTLFPAR